MYLSSMLKSASKLTSFVASSSRTSSVLKFSSSSVSRGTFEPDYLDSSGPVIPTYPPINIQIKGND